MPRGTWVYAPAKTKLKKEQKAAVQERFRPVIEELKQQHVKPPERGQKWNYIADIFDKWHGSFYYLVAKYHCPDPRAFAPEFDHPFARLEALTGGSFNLAYFRHTEQWWTIAQALPLDECLDLIRQGGLFTP